MTSVEQKLNLVDVLNAMLTDTLARVQLTRNAKDILAKCEVISEYMLALIAEKPCLESTLSKDGRGRCQRSIRIAGKKINFRPWHICWIDANGAAPSDLQYSHRCHVENCCEPTHGVWESDVKNKDRNRCQSASHLVLPDGKIIVLCSHNPPCITPRSFSKGDPNVFDSLDDYVAVKGGNLEY